MIDFFLNHPMIFVLIIAYAISVVWIIKFSDVLNAKPYVLAIAVFVSMIPGFICAVLLAKFEVLTGVSEAANIRLFGCFFIAPLTLYLFSKIFKVALPVAYDILSFVFIICNVAGRIPCFVNNCCVGQMIGGTTYRWPIREAEIVLELVFLVIIAHKLLKKKRVFTGKLLPIFYITYGIFRILVEFIRQSDILHFGVFDFAQIWSLICIAIGVFTLMWFSRKYDASVPKIKKNQV